MRTSEAQAIFSMSGGASASRADAIATELRQASILPKGGRGPHAPHLTAQHLASYTLAMAGSDRITDAVRAVSFLAKLVGSDGVSLNDRLTGALSNLPSAARILHLRISSNPWMAEIALDTKDGRPEIEWFFMAAQWRREDLDPRLMGATHAGRIGHVGGVVLSLLAGELGGHFRHEGLSAAQLAELGA